MKFLVVLLAVASLTHGKVVIPDNHTAFGYLKNSIAEAEKIRVREEQYLQQQRIVGGVPAGLGQVPFQAGLLLDVIGFEGRGVCGGSLISANRVISAAHCWADGQNQVWRVEVILGSVTLFTGGNRQFTSVFINHPSWFPLLVRNDVGVIYLPTSVTFSSTIAPVSLPQGAELEETFAGESAIASGFGLTVDGGSISSNQFLSQVRLNVLSNSECRLGFPLILQDSNICTSGIGGVGTCSGDSGGPLYITRGNGNVLIGVTSFGIALGCQVNFPAAYARVTSFMPFINQHL
uniref:Chymotrypsin-like serine protease n=1 Tax=Ostrinia nubilalis TaxID=29057 RepID=Q56IC2_OSTNU|nr:chymotrypsin-like serine protease [Ostrinia nubilalis]